MTMKRKNNLDERQEQVLLQIEHRGCWIAFWGLLIVMAVELFMNLDPKSIAGEWILFMILSVYLYAECMKNNIWDRHLKPNLKTNLLVSILGSAACGLIMGFMAFLRYPVTPVGAAATGILTAAFVFIPTILLLSVSSRIHKRKKAKEEEEEQEEL